jgi:hypothetical protein
MEKCPWCGLEMGDILGRHIEIGLVDIPVEKSNRWLMCEFKSAERCQFGSCECVHGISMGRLTWKTS